uniref:PH domain-containing protein n=1 Tax=Panagrellus redivivus TaxID=6233 RepID=A0A7E4UNV9_PANRE
MDWRHVRVFKPSLFGNKWKFRTVLIDANGTLEVFSEEDNPRLLASLHLVDVLPFICVGNGTDSLPVTSPKLPTTGASECVVAIANDATASNVHWLLFGSHSELEDWLSNIYLAVRGYPVAAKQRPGDALRTVLVELRLGAAFWRGQVPGMSDIESRQARVDRDADLDPPFRFSTDSEPMNDIEIHREVEFEDVRHAPIREHAI